MSAHAAGREALALSRDELAARTVECLNRGNRRNPDVLLVDLGGRRAVVKDFAPRGPLVRATLGRWIHGREVRAYERLAGLAAVPRFLGWIDPLAFAVEYRPGRRISRHLLEDASPEFADALEEAVAAMHERGVVHLDLGHRSNVLVDAEGLPVLIDFGSALCLRPGSPWVRWLGHYDRRAVRKWRTKLARQESRRGAAAAGSEGEAGGASDGGRAASRPT